MLSCEPTRRTCERQGPGQPCVSGGGCRGDNYYQILNLTAARYLFASEWHVVTHAPRAPIKTGPAVRSRPLAGVPLPARGVCKQRPLCRCCSLTRSLLGGDERS